MFHNYTELISFVKFIKEFKLLYKYKSMFVQKFHFIELNSMILYPRTFEIKQ